MSDRKLRSGTRKDYAKMDDVDVTLIHQSADEDNRSSSEDDFHACARNVNKQPSKQHRDDGGAILNYEVVVGNSDDSGNDAESSESDEELREADQKLQALRKQQKLLFKQSKRARIAQETEEIQKSLRKLKKNGKTGKSKITSKSLRTMDDVMEEVDQLMDKNMKIKAVESSSETETDCVPRRSGSSSGRSVKPKTRVHSEQEGVKHQERRSGKSKNSLTSDYKFPQKWPHSFFKSAFCP